jgi:hypothetical protein
VDRKLSADYQAAALAGSAGDEQRVRVAAEAPDRAQRDVAYDTRNAEARFVEQSTGQSLIRSKIGTDYARKIVDRATNLPALDHLFYGQKPPLEPVLIGLPFQRYLGKDIDRPRYLGNVDYCLIARNYSRRLKLADTLKAGPG